MFRQRIGCTSHRPRRCRQIASHQDGMFSSLRSRIGGCSPCLGTFLRGSPRRPTRRSGPTCPSHTRGTPFGPFVFGTSRQDNPCSLNHWPRSGTCRLHMRCGSRRSPRQQIPTLRDNSGNWPPPPQQQTSRRHRWCMRSRILHWNVSPRYISDNLCLVCLRPRRIPPHTMYNTWNGWTRTSTLGSEMRPSPDCTGLSVPTTTGK
jgi:hypothetical protein